MKPSALRILVSLDGSVESESVFAALMPVVRHLPADITLVHVVPDLVHFHDAKVYLEKAADTLRRQDVQSRMKVGIGPVVSELQQFLDMKRFDFLAMSSRGRNGLDRFIQGSVTESVLRKSEIPILVTRPDMQIRDWERIIVAMDGSNRACEILADAIPLAKSLGSTLDLVWVRPPTEDSLARRAEDGLQKATVQAGSGGVPTETHILDGTLPETLTRYADTSGAGLICMTTHGRTGLARLVMGSVAEKVLRTSECPVMIRRCRDFSPTERIARSKIRAGEPLN